MNEIELEQRKVRAANETLVIAPTEGGFRVYNPANITHLFMVSGIPESPKCNCPDFDANKSDPEWRCKHVLAVLNQALKHQDSKVASPEATERKENDAKASEPAEKKRSRSLRKGHSQMMIKRSISPDGRINSLSVNFLNPIDGVTDEEIKQQAEKAIKLQAEIVDQFFKRNASRGPEAHPQERPANGANQNGSSQNGSNRPASGGDGAVPAQLLNIAGMDTRGGWKTFINVQVNGITTKLFGTKQELSKVITAAGFSNIAENISQGMMLSLPCRVVTKRSPDGKYLNIERVLPLKALEPKGRAGQ